MPSNTIKTKEIKVNSLIKQVTKKDSLFNGYYLIDPYQNCSFGCLYCDSKQDKNIYIKYNALEILEKELKQIPRNRVIIGSVHDPYQPIERKTSLTRSIIKMLLDQGFPIHILTKSTLIKRDMDLFTQNDHDVFITFSVISNDQRLVSELEPDTPSFIQRLKTMNMISNKGIRTGIALIPILPCLIDERIESIIKQVSDHNAHYMLFQHLFLKGDQKTQFLDFIEQYHPSCLIVYQDLFNDSIYPPKSYRMILNNRIKKICGRYNLPTSLPK